MKRIKCNSRNKIVSASDLFDSDEEIAEKYADESISEKSEANLGDELAIDAIRDTETTHKNNK